MQNGPIEFDAMEVGEIAGFRIELAQLNETTFVALCPELGIKSFGTCIEEVLEALRSEVLFEMTRAEGEESDPSSLMMTAERARHQTGTRLIYLPQRKTVH